MPEPRTARAAYGGKAPRCLEPRTKAASPVGRSVRWPFKSVASLIPILAPNLENQLAMVESDFAVGTQAPRGWRRPYESRLPRGQPLSPTSPGA